MRKLLVHIAVCLSLASFCQNSNYVAASYTPGFLLAHRADIKNLAAHNFGIEVAYESDMTDTRWGKNYNKPSVGYGLLYYNLGKEETGHAIGHKSLMCTQIEGIKLLAVILMVVCSSV